MQRVAAEVADALHDELVKRILCSGEAICAQSHIFTPHPPNSAVSTPLGMWTSSVRVMPSTSIVLALEIELEIQIRTISLVVASADSL